VERRKRLTQRSNRCGGERTTKGRTEDLVERLLLLLLLLIGIGMSAGGLKEKRREGSG
jgi:hypothetical protein